MIGEITLKNATERIEGPLVFFERSVNCGLHDAVEVIGEDGQIRLGRVAALDRERIVVELYEPTRDLSIKGTRARFSGRDLRFGLGPGMVGRILNGVGEPLDSGPPIPIVEEYSVTGLPMNPVARALPSDFIETGISTIDLMNSLVRGQKLPIFSGGGLPHNRIALDIASHARLLGAASGEFVVVFAGIGISHRIAELFMSVIRETGALDRTLMFLSLAHEASTQRLLAPRFALTAAEYLAFVEGRHVLVIMTDMTAYCESLREVSASHGEIPARKGFPGHMYSDLASIYERAGSLGPQHGGTLTLLPILTMPDYDITHPIPDLTGYITEGQIVLDADLHRKDIYPPVAVLPSLSRLAGKGTGKDCTDEDHPALAAQLYAAYARTQAARMLAAVVGSDSISPEDRVYLDFGDRFERELVHQQSPRQLAESMDIGWQLLQSLPLSALGRLNDEQIHRHILHRKDDHSGAAPVVNTDQKTERS
ncbi:MAG: V-type ATP synthase subunit B [Gammaproteobacteria bacterium]|nr:V-type ATP synthase subunit B [Gammaproteobacteria bacterium]